MVKLYIKDLQSAWLRGSTGEQRASIREHRESRWTKRALAREQSSGIIKVVNDGSRAIGFENYYVYIYILSLTFEIKIELPTLIRSLQGVVEVARRQNAFFFCSYRIRQRKSQTTNQKRKAETRKVDNARAVTSNFGLRRIIYSTARKDHGGTTSTTSTGHQL